MLKNFFKTAWRNLWKSKGFSAINIFGLSIGVAAFLLIVNYLWFQYSFDNFHANKTRIYRVPMEISEKGGKAQTFAFTYPAVAAAMQKDFPEIEQTVRFRRQGGIVSHGTQNILEQGAIYYVDPAIFKIFSFRFKEGNTTTAFAQLNDAVITHSTATKYFGQENPLGKTLHYQQEDFVVKAVLEDLPANSHLQFSILLNYNKYIQITKNRGGDAENNWGWSDFYTYVLLKQGTDAKALQAKMPAFAQRHLGDDMKKNGYAITFALQPMEDIHLRSKYDYELSGNGNLTYLKYLGIAALFILFIAWINYVNLSTARALDRSKEVGVRKVLGANKFQLIRQFLAESLLINIAGVLIGFMIFKLTLPYFSTLVQKNINELHISSWQFWLSMAGIFLLGALLAGFYPAFVLSSFQPIQSLKTAAGFAGIKSGRNILRKSLVVLQFVAAIVLIAGAMGYYFQLRYMQNRDLGVNIQQTLVLTQSARQDSSKIAAFDSFINDLESNPGIKSVTASTSVPGGEVGGSSGFTLQNSTNEKRCRIFGIDNKFIPQYGLNIIAGRNFITDHPATNPSLTLNIIVNETAAGIFGFSKPSDIIGKKIAGSGFNCEVVGVVRDYHQESLQYSFDPIVFYPEQETDFSNFSVKLNTGNIPAIVDFAKQKWTARFPESPFVYYFLDERFNEQYKNDRIFASVIGVFTLLAIIIACLGLFGLSLYTINKRSKELSIRKILGASVIQICSLITKDYLKLILYAALVSIPLAWFLLNSWIKDYAFHITIGWWLFVLPLALISLIALLTVIYQSLKAALSNPVKSLRTE